MCTNSKWILFGLISCVGISVLSACSGKNIHTTLTDDKSVLVRQWTLQTRKFFEAGNRGSDYSNPVLFENTLIFGNRSVGIVSIYPMINQLRWVLPIENGVMSGLTVHKQSIYFGAGDGFLYSVDAENGQVN